MNNKRAEKRALIVLLGVALILLPGLAYSEIPKQINYQGYLTNAAGVPVNGSVEMVFSIYTAASGGSALWTETQNVAVSNGVYNVILGKVTTLNLTFDIPYYIGVKIGADAEMTPRKPFTSVPYAMYALTPAGPQGPPGPPGVANGIQRAVYGTVNGSYSNRGMSIVSGTGFNIEPAVVDISYLGVKITFIQPFPNTPTCVVTPFQTHYDAHPCSYWHPDDYWPGMQLNYFLVLCRPEGASDAAAMVPFSFMCVF